MTDLHFAVILYSGEKEICLKLPHVGQPRTYTCIVLNSMEERSGRNSKYIADRDNHCYIFGKGSVYCNTGNIKENIKKFSEVAPHYST